MEIEKEQERVEAAKAGRSYSRENEEVVPWPLAALTQARGSGALPFYAASELSVKTWHSSTAPLHLPSYCLVSKNHFNPTWSVKSYRRLKNVMVCLEWIPSQAQLTLTTQGTYHLPCIDVSVV